MVRFFRLGRLEPFAQPSAGELPVAADGGVRHAQGASDLLIRQTRKEFEFNHPAGGGVGALETIEQRFERFRVDANLRAWGVVVRKRDLPTETAFRRPVFAAMVDENPPHLTCGDGEEVGPVLPFHWGAIEDPEECLVDKRCGLQRVGGAFGGHVLPSPQAQVAVNSREKLVLDSQIPLLELPQ